MSRRRRCIGWFLTVLTLLSHVTAPFAHGSLTYPAFGSDLPFVFAQDYCVTDPAHSPGDQDPAPGTKIPCPVCAAFQLGGKLLPPSLTTVTAPVVLADAEISAPFEVSPLAVERFRLPPAQAPPTVTA